MIMAQQPTLRQIDVPFARGGQQPIAGRMAVLLRPVPERSTMSTLRTTADSHGSVTLVAAGDVCQPSSTAASLAACLRSDHRVAG